MKVQLGLLRYRLKKAGYAVQYIVLDAPNLSPKAFPGIEDFFPLESKFFQWFSSEQISEKSLKKKNLAKPRLPAPKTSKTPSHSPCTPITF